MPDRPPVAWTTVDRSVKCGSARFLSLAITAALLASCGGGGGGRATSARCDGAACEAVDLAGLAPDLAAEAAAPASPDTHDDDRPPVAPPLDAGVGTDEDVASDAPIEDAPIVVDVAAETGPSDAADVSPIDVVMDLGPSLPAGELMGFQTAPGTFSAAFDLGYVAADADVRVHYTVDGSLPTAQSRAWPRGEPLRIAATTLVRVLAVRGAEQQTRSALYLQVTSALAGSFTSNLPLVFLHAFAPTEPLPSNHDNTSGGLVITKPEAGVSRPIGAVDLADRLGFRVRGRSSRVWDQRSYTLELWEAGADDDRSAPVLGMPAESDWVLYGPWTVDRTLLRNAFLYALSNRLGHYAPRTRFVEVFMQSAGKPIAATDYRGVYTLMEKVKRDPQRVNIANLRPTDALAPAITGGYLFKVDDQLSPGEASLSAAGHLMEMESPNWDEITAPQRMYLADYLNDFAAAAAAPDGRNPRTNLHYSDYIDVDSFIDFHIFNVFVKNPDAFRLSAYYHKDRGAKLKAGPLWDLDRTTGATDERVTSPEGWSAPNGTNVFAFGWWGGLFKDPAFEARYWTRFEALLATDLRSDVFAEIIAPMATELATAQQRHFDRWPSVRPVYGYLPEILQLTRWLDARVAWAKSHLRMR